jgi:hypothetical protein
VPSCREARRPRATREARRRTRLSKATARANAATRGMNGPGCSGNGGAASSVKRNASAHGRPARRRRVRLLPREVLPSDYQRRISGRSAAQRHAASISCLPQQMIYVVHMLRELSRHCWSAVSLSHETGRLHWLRLSAAASWFSRSVLVLVRFYHNPYGSRGIERVSIPSKSKSPPIRINPLQSIWIENNRTSPYMDVV